MSQTFLTNCKKEEEDVRGKDWKIPKVLIVTHQIEKISKSDFRQNFFWRNMHEIHQGRIQKKPVFS